MTTYTYPHLALYKLEGTDLNILLRITIVSLFLLLILLPLQLVVMVLYTPIAIWNALKPVNQIEATPATPVDMEVAFT